MGRIGGVGWCERGAVRERESVGLHGTVSGSVDVGILGRRRNEVDEGGVEVELGRS